MKKYLAAFLLIVPAIIAAAYAQVTVTPQTIAAHVVIQPQALTSAQVAQFTALVNGIPAGEKIVSLNVSVLPDGTGRLNVQAR